MLSVTEKSELVDVEQNRKQKIREAQKRYMISEKGKNKIYEAIKRYRKRYPERLKQINKVSQKKYVNTDKGRKKLNEAQKRYYEKIKQNKKVASSRKFLVLTSFLKNDNDIFTL